MATLAIAGIGFYLVWWAVGFTLGGRRPQDVGGFLTLTLLILLFSGVQLLFLGVLGEYLGRVFEEVKRRPHWIVAETVSGGERRPRSSLDDSCGRGHEPGRVSARGKYSVEK